MQLNVILEAAKEQGVPHTYVHFFGDGRDTDSRSAAGYCQCGDLLSLMEKEECGGLATIVGRYHAMDRDKRHVDRDKTVMGGEGAAFGESTGAVDGIKANYENNANGEFLKPIIVNRNAGRIEVRPFRPADGVCYSQRSREFHSVCSCSYNQPTSAHAGHHHHVAIQHPVHVPRRVPAPGNDERARGVVVAGSLVRIVAFPLSLSTPLFFASAVPPLDEVSLC
ncbi:BPG-independent [Mycena leptocephala]|nr:BPG-independent [Mycena leptocephala]